MLKYETRRNKGGRKNMGKDAVKLYASNINQAVPSVTLIIPLTKV
jgi:hypothetical protein